MQAALPLMAIVGALAAGVVSPGPSFVLIARESVLSSRTSGLWAALGMGLGALCFGAAALAGLQAMLLALPMLYLVLKAAGGLYLAYLGVRMFRAAAKPLDLVTDGERRGSRLRSLVLGLTTQLSNPKTAVVYASVFAAFLPRQFSFLFAASLLAAVFAIEAGWYALVALVLSAGGPRRVYLRSKKWLDRLAGGVMTALGVKLLASALDR